MLSVEEASARILADIHQLDVEHVSIADALGRVCAEEIVATVTMPPWSNSSMDGYAVRSADISPVLSGKPVTLRVVATVPAGGFAPRELKRGEASCSITVAHDPEGADSAARQRDTALRPATVQICDAREVWLTFRPAGGGYQRSDSLARRGSPIRPAMVGVFASTGI